MEEEKKEHELKMKKMELEMEQVFEQKVKEKFHKQKELEEEVWRIFVFFLNNANSHLDFFLSFST